MSWSNYELKGRARAALRGRMAPYVGLTLLYLVLAGWLETALQPLLPAYTELSDWVLAQYLRGAQQALRTALHQMPGDAMAAQLYAQLQQLLADLPGSFTGRDLFWNLAVTLGGAALAIFVYRALNVGLCRWYMEARGGRPGIGTLFSDFADGRQWRNSVWVLLWVSVATALYSCLFVIPGIIYLYQTILVPWLLAENPYLPRRRAIALSKALTRGEKLRIFWLQFSFIGWYLLLGFASGAAGMAAGWLGTAVSLAGALLLQVYINATMAELYAVMREKALRLGWCDGNELAGFAAPQQW